MLLLAPQIPMIFMGDEWGAQTPFQFFVNFEQEPDLEAAIRKGRAREFEKFTSFTGTVPDPTALETFERSRLDWDEAAREPFVSILAETKHLLDLRKREVLPLMNSAFLDAAYRRQGPGGLDVTWRFEGGTMRFVANFEGRPHHFAGEPGEQVIWQTTDAEALGPWQGRITKLAPA